MGQLQNVQRGSLFMWFFATFVFTLFVIIRFIKNKIDFRQEGEQQQYRQGQVKRQPVNESYQRFDYSVINQDKLVEDDNILQMWIKKIHQYQVYFMPILFPLAINLMTGTSYAFAFIMFFITAFWFIIFNLLKIHRLVVQNRVLRALLENIGYVLSFLMLLNIWITIPV